jgi:hypothetical protein
VTSLSAHSVSPDRSRRAGTLCSPRAPSRRPLIDGFVLHKLAKTIRTVPCPDILSLRQDCTRETRMALFVSSPSPSQADLPLHLHWPLATTPSYSPLFRRPRPSGFLVRFPGSVCTTPVGVEGHGLHSARRKRPCRASGADPMIRRSPCGLPESAGRESTWSIPAKLSRKVREPARQEGTR